MRESTSRATHFIMSESFGYIEALSATSLIIAFVNMVLSISALLICRTFTRANHLSPRQTDARAPPYLAERVSGH